MEAPTPMEPPSRATPCPPSKGLAPAAKLGLGERGAYRPSELMLSSPGWHVAKAPFRSNPADLEWLDWLEWGAGHTAP